MDIVLDKPIETSKEKSKKANKNQIVATEKREVRIGKKLKKLEIKTFKNGVKKSRIISVEKAGTAKKQKKVEV